jgi:galactokinase
MEAGVSSSSAFTVCTAILALHANGFIDKFDRTQIANYVIEGERNVGTASGGMDQTISIMAEKGEAKFIEFIPKIQTHSTPIPSKYAFVIANSLTPSPKAIQSTTRYNKRVVE